MEKGYSAGEAILILRRAYSLMRWEDVRERGEEAMRHHKARTSTLS